MMIETFAHRARLVTFIIYIAVVLFIPYIVMWAVPTTTRTTLLTRASTDE
jgi:hypothetical protein